MKIWSSKKIDFLVPENKELSSPADTNLSFPSDSETSPQVSQDTFYRIPDVLKIDSIEIKLKKPLVENSSALETLENQDRLFTESSLRPYENLPAKEDSRLHLENFKKSANLDKSLDAPSVVPNPPLENPKTNLNFLKISMIIYIFIIAIALVAVAGFFAYSNFEKNRKMTADCLELSDRYSEKGVDISSLKCESTSWLQNLIWVKAMDLTTSERQFRSQEKELLAKISQFETEIEQMEQSLKSLEVSFTAQDYKALDIADLTKNLKNRETYLQYLKQTGADNFVNVGVQIQAYNQSLSLLSNSQSGDFKQYLENFKSKSEAEQIADFSQFQAQKTQLQNLIVVNKLQKNISLKDLDTIIINFDFKNLVAIPNSELVITGRPKVDKYIFEIAISRGYSRQRQAVESALDEQDGSFLQVEARDAFLEMREAAAKVGIELGVVSGYRSVKTQRDLFNQRINQVLTKDTKKLSDFSDEQILNGEVKKYFETALSYTSPPGYSQHHMGYAVDFEDLSEASANKVFGNSDAYFWLSKNNFQNAKKYGFINPYQAGSNMGPEPEPWHYIWLGKENTAL
jgi:LAS superfamily LD-carboxypeptidase LdcB